MNCYSNSVMSTVGTRLEAYVRTVDAAPRPAGAAARGRARRRRAPGSCNVAQRLTRTQIAVLR